MNISVQMVDRLKSILRTKAISYGTLARGIGLSEAAMKRAFSEKAFSLKRIDEICAYLNVSAEDLLTSEPGDRNLQRSLNEEQELALAADEKRMCFFYLIAAKLSLNKIQREFQFTDQEVDRFLLDLDKVNLIQLQSDRQYKVLVQQDFYWPQGGVLESRYRTLIKRDFIDHEFLGPKEHEIFASGRLSEASVKILRKHLLSLADTVREMMRLDSRYHSSGSTNVTLYCGFRPWTLPMTNKYRRN